MSNLILVTLSSVLKKHRTLLICVVCMLIFYKVLSFPRYSNLLVKNQFCPQNDKFWCILPQLLKGRKHGQSLEALEHGFYDSITKTKLTNTMQKLSKTFTVRLKAAVALSYRP